MSEDEEEQDENEESAHDDDEEDVDEINYTYLSKDSGGRTHSQSQQESTRSFCLTISGVLGYDEE